MNELVLNTYTEDKFEVLHNDKWIKFMVSGNKRFSSKPEREFWLVTNCETKEEIKLFCLKAQELVNDNKLKLR